MPKYTYEESVRWIRGRPELAELITTSYLDEDNLVAAERFASSEEFAEIVRILRLDGLSARLKILDLGCGNGIASFAFASRGHLVFAVDADASQDVGIGAAARLGAAVSDGSICATRAFAEALPFRDATFDLVYVRQALHHFSNLRQGVAECARILKPGGLLFATREHVVSDERQLETFLSNHILHRLHGAEHAYSVDEYVSALKQAKLSVVKRFAHFDTVINHYPISQAELRQRVFKELMQRLGLRLATVLINLPLATICYCKGASYLANKYPGRHFAFLCVKRKNGDFRK